MLLLTVTILQLLPVKVSGLVLIQGNDNTSQAGGRPIRLHCRQTSKSRNRNVLANKQVCTIDTLVFYKNFIEILGYKVLNFWQILAYRVLTKVLNSVPMKYVPFYEWSMVMPITSLIKCIINHS